MSTVAKRQITIRTDASRVMGTGHVMRSLTLARVLRAQGADVRFVCREHDGHLCELIEQTGFAVTRLPQEVSSTPSDTGPPTHSAWLGTSWERDAALTKAAMGDQMIDWLIVDHYALDLRWQQSMRGRARKIMVIDDLADRLHDCDVLLDQNFFAEGKQRYVGKVPSSTTLLLGPHYALLGPDYAQLRRRIAPRSGTPSRILVSFGGADHLGLTLRTVNALLTLYDHSIAADVVLSRAAADFSEIESMLEDYPRIQLHDRVASLAPFMLAADLAIGAGGATHWERMCLGLPTLVITMAENQRDIAHQLAEQGLIRWLGDAADVDVPQIRDALDRLIKDGLDPQWSSRCMALVDGQGVQRVAAVLQAEPAMPMVVRHGEIRDEDLLLEWANDPVTRANGYNTDTIAREDHVRWYRNKLRNPIDCRLFVIETATGVPVGQVRFDRRNGEWEISYAVAPPFRGRGIGRPMLEAALNELDQGSDTIIGQVKPDNAASRRIFEAMGFALRSSDPERLVFERHPHN